MDNKNVKETYEQIKKQAAKDLKDAKFVAWGDNDDTVIACTTVSSKLNALSDNYKKRYESLKNSDVINKDIRANEKLLSICAEVLETKKDDAEAVEVLSTIQHETQNVLETNQKALKEYSEKQKEFQKAAEEAQIKSKIIDDIVSELKPEVHNDGKAYFAPIAVKIAKLLTQIDGR